MTKHTPGKLIVDGSYLETDQHCVARVGTHNTRTPTDDANANRLALCWNTHDQLLEALKLAKSVLINPSQRTTDIIESAINAATQNPHSATKE